MFAVPPPPSSFVSNAFDELIRAGVPEGIRSQCAPALAGERHIPPRACCPSLHDWRCWWRVIKHQAFELALHWRSRVQLQRDNITQRTGAGLIIHLSHLPTIHENLNHRSPGHGPRCGKHSKQHGDGYGQAARGLPSRATVFSLLNSCPEPVL